jgi:glucokinase
VVCYFTVSTGIGGGIVVGGHLYRGASGQAGEFGHLKLHSEGPPCFCGDRGCLEALASGPSIARRARAAAASQGGSLRALFDQDPALVTAERLAEAVRQGDAVARQVWEAAMTDLGAGVATVMNLFNPDAVVIGGGVSRSADLLLPIVRREVAARAMPMVARAARVESAALGDDVGIVGAALLAREPAA